LAPFNMKLQKKKSKIEYPKEFVRIDDGEVFYRAGDGKYYLKWLVLNFPNHHHLGYEYKTLAKTYSKYFRPVY